MQWRPNDSAWSLLVERRTSARVDALRWYVFMLRAFIMVCISEVPAIETIDATASINLGHDRRRGFSLLPSSPPLPSRPISNKLSKIQNHYKYMHGR